MLAEIGLAALTFAFGSAVFAIFGAVWGARQKSERWVVSARNAALAAFPLLLVAAACLLAALLFVLGLAASRGQERERRLSTVVCFCTMNNILMTIVAAQFFGVHEVLMCALYSVPFNALLIPYRMLASRLAPR